MTGERPAGEPPPCETLSHVFLECPVVQPAVAWQRGLWGQLGHGGCRGSESHVHMAAGADVSAPRARLLAASDQPHAWALPCAQGCSYQGCSYQGCSYQGCSYQGCSYQGCSYQGWAQGCSHQPHGDKAAAAWALHLCCRLVMRCCMAVLRCEVM